MSYATVYQMPRSGPVVEIAELGNSWGGAMRIWQPLIDRYLIPEGLPEMERHGRLCKMMMEHFAPLWPLVDDKRLERFERLSLAATFDSCVIELDHCAEMADLLLKFRERHPYGEGAVDHLPAIADLLCAVHPESLGVCFRWTSVSEDLWQVRIGDPDDGETRPYDASRDEGHWFLFDRYDK